MPEPKMEQNRLLENLQQSMARLGTRLESALKLLSAISSLTSVPIDTDSLTAGADRMMGVLVRELEGVDACSLLLYNDDTGMLELLAAKGQDDFWTPSSGCFNTELCFQPGEGLAGRVFQDKRPYFWDRETGRQELLKIAPNLRTPVSLASLPLKSSDRILGVLNISFARTAPFDHVRQRDLLLLCCVVANLVREFMLRLEVQKKADALQSKVNDWEREAAGRKRAEQEIDILAKFPDENPNPVLRVGDDLRILYANPASAVLLEQWKLHENDYLPESWRSAIEKSRRVGSLAGYEIEIDGQFFSFMIVPVSEARSVYLYGRNITDHKQYEEQLLLLASVFENTIEGIIITDAKGKIETVNGAFTQITGYSAVEVKGKNPRLLKSDRHDPGFYKEMWQSLINSGKWRGQIWNRRKNGEAYPQWQSINAITDANGDVTHYVAVFHDITDIKNKEEKIKYQAEHDPLTGLPNRALFNDRLAMTLARASRNGEMVALMFLDLDDFKHVNDSLGHATGDMLLKKAANRLKKCLREEDTVARLGGDEFTVILPQISGKSEAAQAAGRVIDTLGAPYQLAGQEVHVGVSIGITVYPLDGKTPETLVKYADMAMYSAKERGKNNFQVYSPAMNEDAALRLDMDRGLRSALRNEEFIIHYQPKADLTSGAIIGVEALLRWMHPEKGMLHPADFIPWAEETGLMVSIGRWALREACRQIQAWLDSGLPEMTLMVNLSARHFLADDLVDAVEKTLLDTGLPPYLLEIEVTETSVARDVETAVEAMNHLHDMGVRLCLDDFGTGYSSLAHLKRFPIHTLKIDGSFIRDIPHHSDDLAITTAIVFLARSLGLKSAAEGVETMEQARFLKELGCNEIQGFLFHKPMPAREMEEVLRKGDEFVLEG